MKSKPFVQLWAIVIVALSVPLLYVGGYLAMLSPREIAIIGGGGGFRTVLWPEPAYRFADVSDRQGWFGASARSTVVRHFESVRYA